MTTRTANHDTVARLEAERYLSLETRRRSGKAVATAVWFAGDDGVLYIRTFRGTAKVGRMVHDPAVRIAPCDKAGKVTGAWVAARARIAEGAEATRAEGLLNRKYGLTKHLADAWYRWRLGKSVVFAIEP